MLPVCLAGGTSTEMLLKKNLFKKKILIISWLGGIFKALPSLCCAVGCSWAAAAFAFALLCPWFLKLSHPRQMLSVSTVTTPALCRSPGLSSRSPSVCLFGSGTSLSMDQILLLPWALLGSQDLDVMAQGRRFQGSSLCLLSSERSSAAAEVLVKL